MIADCTPATYSLLLLPLVLLVIFCRTISTLRRRFPPSPVLGLACLFTTTPPSTTTMTITRIMSKTMTTTTTTTSDIRWNAVNAENTLKSPLLSKRWRSGAAGRWQHSHKWRPGGLFQPGWPPTLLTTLVRRLACCLESSCSDLEKKHILSSEQAHVLLHRSVHRLCHRH